MPANVPGTISRTVFPAVRLVGLGGREPVAEGYRECVQGSWRKSTHSDANGGDCVEVANVPHMILVRDTKNRDDGTLRFTAEAWRAFAAELRWASRDQPGTEKISRS
jgi:hypothetical protein